MELDNENADYTDNFPLEEPEEKPKKHNGIRVLAIMFVLFVYFVIYLKILFIS
jgi:hypothetical protein